MGNVLLERMRERSYHVLSERGLKLTKPRRALIDYLFDRPDWQFLAGELHSELNSRLPGLISRATVYRTLELLEEAGVVESTPDGKQASRYQLSDLQACHYRLVDVNTGESTPFAVDKELRSLLRRICREQGFTHQYHALEVFGEFAARRRRKPSTNGVPSQLAASAAAHGAKGQ